MITLQPITETNYLEAVALQVSPEQQAFVAPAVGILARAYAYRRHRQTPGEFMTAAAWWAWR